MIRLVTRIKLQLGTKTTWTIHQWLPASKWFGAPPLQFESHRSSGRSFYRPKGRSSNGNCFPGGGVMSSHLPLLENWSHPTSLYYTSPCLTLGKLDDATSCPTLTPTPGMVDTGRMWQLFLGPAFRKCHKCGKLVGVSDPSNLWYTLLYNFLLVLSVLPWKYFSNVTRFGLKKFSLVIPASLSLHSSVGIKDTRPTGPCLDATKVYLLFQKPPAAAAGHSIKANKGCTVRAWAYW